MLVLWRQCFDLWHDMLHDAKADWRFLLGLALVGPGVFFGLRVSPELAGPFVVNPDILPYASFVILGYAAAMAALLLAGVLMLTAGLLRSAVGRRFSGFFHDRFGKDMLRVCGVGLCIACAASAASLAVSALAAGAGAGLFGRDAPASVEVAAGVLGSIAAAFVLARLAPALAAAVAVRQFVLVRAWRWTSGRWAPAFLLFAAISVPVDQLLPRMVDGQNPLSIWIAAVFAIAGLAAGLQILIGVAAWRRVSPADALEAAA